MLNALVTLFAGLVGKIIGFGILFLFFAIFLKWRFKSWKNFEEEMKMWELVLLRNIGIFCMALIMIFVGLLVSNMLGDKGIFSSEYLMSGIGLTVAFWYGYKKYERDKEIELIRDYTNKYNSINHKIVENSVPENYKELFNLWYEEFYLYQKGYISDGLWQEWEYWIKEQIRDGLHLAFIEYRNFKTSLNDTSDIDLHVLDSNSILLGFGSFFSLQFEEKNTASSNYLFFIFIRKTIEQYLDTRQFVTKDLFKSKLIDEEEYIDTKEWVEYTKSFLNKNF